MWPVASDDEARDILVRIKAEHAEAAHNCSAYVIRDPQVMRYSDDGEPSGTAGQPILNVLMREQVENALVIVTRYYGGIKLGAGGLVRAYTQAAKMALDAATIAAVCAWTSIELCCSYPQYDRLVKIAQDSGAVITDTSYTDSITIKLNIPATDADMLMQQLTNASAGTATLHITGQLMAPAPPRP